MKKTKKTSPRKPALSRGRKPLPAPVERAGDPEVTAKLAASYGLNAVEYKKVLGIMGRLPTHTELGIFSVMWSEHCSYKTSKPHLRASPPRASG